jgi:hypothetical protein
VIGRVAALRAERNLGLLLQPLRATAAQGTTGNCGRWTRTGRAGSFPAPQRALGYLDIFALSSDTERMPLSMFEAMASARSTTSMSSDVRELPRRILQARYLPEAPHNAVIATKESLRADQNRLDCRLLMETLHVLLAPLSAGSVQRRRRAMPQSLSVRRSWLASQRRAAALPVRRHARPV